MSDQENNIIISVDSKYMDFFSDKKYDPPLNSNKKEVKLSKYIYTYLILFVLFLLLVYILFYR